MPPSTIYEKIWRSHVVCQPAGEPALLYIDRHFIHEATSPQAFARLKTAGRKVRRPDLTIGIMDHLVPTQNRHLPLLDPMATGQFEALDRNCREHSIRLFDVNSRNQGIVHVVGPELGLVWPWTTVVCGDSHTSTHGALGALAFGIGTSEVEHVLATQCLMQFESKTMLINVDGKCPAGVTAKDIALTIIRTIGIAGGTGCVLEYAGSAVRELSIEGRMTICNMSIEAGARAGIVAPDQTTIAYLEGRPFMPRGREFDELVESWSLLPSDPEAKHDARADLNVSSLEPQVTWGTNPEMVADVSGKVPSPEMFSEPEKQAAARHALQYMDIKPGTPIVDIPIDHVFIGSCTNSRIQDLRLAASVVAGKKVARSIKQALVVAGSRQVKAQAEKEGLDRIFKDAGFEWRDSGCSMCIAMNEDVAPSGARCASTSNRNFEGRQGKGSRTHLVSPPMAAAAAIAGHFVDVRTLNLER